MEEKKSSKSNLVIHLSGDKYLISDGLCYWIATKTRKKDKKGNTVYQRVSGYHPEIEDAVDSYIRNHVRKTELTGEIKDLTELLAKTHKEVKGWVRKVEKALKEMEK